MAWGAVIGGLIGLGGSLFGANKAEKSADKNMALQYQMMQMQQALAMAQMDQQWNIYQNDLDWRDLQWDNSMLLQDRVFQDYLFNRDMAADQYRNQQMLQDYYFGRQDRFDQVAQQERDWYLQDLDWVRQQAAAERGFALDQFNYAQGTAADERLWDLMRLSTLDGMEQQNRQFAVDQYNWQRELAAMEAQADRAMYDQNYANKQADVAYDRRQLEQHQLQLLKERQESIAAQRDAQQQLLDEREWTIDELRANQALAQEERALDMAIRNQYMAQMEGGRARLNSRLAGMGTPAERRQYGEADFNRVSGDLSRKYQELTDRAVEKASSQNEANLIRRGMDVSSAADAARGIVASQASNAYIDAETRAYQEAMSQIQGLNNMALSNEQQDMATRANLVQEALAEFNAPLAALQNSPVVRSGIYDRLNPNSAAMAINGPSAAYSQPGISSVYDRQLASAMVNAPRLFGTGYAQYNVGSANNYQAPIGLNSLAVQASGIPSAIGQQVNIPMPNYNAVSYSPSGVNISQPTMDYSAFSNLMNSYGNMANMYGNQNNFWQQQAAGAYGAAGGYLADLGTAFGNYLDSGWGSNRYGDPSYTKSVYKG